MWGAAMRKGGTGEASASSFSPPRITSHYRLIHEVHKQVLRDNPMVNACAERIVILEFACVHSS